MEIYIKGNGLMVKHMEKVYFAILGDRFMMANGNQICNMVKVLRFGNLEQLNTKVILKKVRKQVKVDLNLKVVHMTVISLMDNSREKASIILLTPEKYIRVIS